MPLKKKVSKPNSSPSQSKTGKPKKVKKPKAPLMKSGPAPAPAASQTSKTKTKTSSSVKKGSSSSKVEKFPPLLTPLPIISARPSGATAAVPLGLVKSKVIEVYKD